VRVRRENANFWQSKGETHTKSQKGERRGVRGWGFNIEVKVNRANTQRYQGERGANPYYNQKNHKTIGRGLRGDEGGIYSSLGGRKSFARGKGGRQEPRRIRICKIEGSRWPYILLVDILEKFTRGPRQGSA